MKSSSVKVLQLLLIFKFSNFIIIIKVQPIYSQCVYTIHGFFEHLYSKLVLCAHIQIKI